MNKKIKIILVLAAVLLILASLATAYFLRPKNPVETEEEAIDIAKEYVVKKYGHPFSDYYINVYFFEKDDLERTKEQNCWEVSYGKNDWDNYDGGPIVLGGGGPSVIIRKSDGKVVRCELQK